MHDLIKQLVEQSPIMSFALLFKYYYGFEFVSGQLYDNNEGLQLLK